MEKNRIFKVVHSIKIALYKRKLFKKAAEQSLRCKMYGELVTNNWRSKKRCVSVINWHFHSKTNTLNTLIKKERKKIAITF